MEDMDNIPDHIKPPEWKIGRVLALSTGLNHTTEKEYQIRVMHIHDLVQQLLNDAKNLDPSKGVEFKDRLKDVYSAIGVPVQCSNDIQSTMEQIRDEIGRYIEKLPKAAQRRYKLVRVNQAINPDDSGTIFIRPN